VFDTFVQKVAVKLPKSFYMKFSRLQNHLLKLFAVVAASLILPGLALADNDHGKGKHDRDSGKPEHGNNKDRDPAVSSVPEANPAIVLVPFVGAVLLVSSLQLLRRRSC
jgi:hypothetical protein